MCVCVYSHIYLYILANFPDIFGERQINYNTQNTCKRRPKLRDFHYLRFRPIRKLYYSREIVTGERVDIKIDGMVE